MTVRVDVLSVHAGGRAGAGPGDGATADDQILIVDGHELFATSLLVTLREHSVHSSHPGISGFADVMAHAHELRPAVVVLALHLGHDGDGQIIDGVELVRPLTRLGCAVLVVSGRRDQPREAAAVAAGAVALVPGTASLTTLLAVIRAARAGRPVVPARTRQAWLPCHEQHRARRRERNRRFDRLSAPELEILLLLAQGMRAHDVAVHLAVSMTSVLGHVRSILGKLEVGSQLEAVALFIKHRSRP